MMKIAPLINKKENTKPKLILGFFKSMIFKVYLAIGKLSNIMVPGRNEIGFLLPLNFAPAIIFKNTNDI